MSLSPVFDKSVKKFVKKLDNTSKERLRKAIHKLCENPFPSDSVRVQGQKSTIFRVRIGDFRVLYAVIYQSNELIILKVDKRSRVYD